MARRPPAVLLILVNSLLFLGLACYSANPVGLFLAPILTLWFAAISGVWHAILLLIERRYVFHPAARTGLFLLPLMLVVLLPLAGVGPADPPNHSHRLASPSGRFEVRVSASDYWSFSFRDVRSGSVFRGKTDFIGTLNVYWIWDADDRLWVYNSDNGRVWFWHLVEGEWERQKWGYGHTKEIDADLTPPEALYPDYAR